MYNKKILFFVFITAFLLITTGCSKSGSSAGSDKYKYKLTIDDTIYKIYDVLVVNDEDAGTMVIKAITKLPDFKETLPENPIGQFTKCDDFPIWCLYTTDEAQHHSSKMTFEKTDTPGEIAVVYHFGSIKTPVKIVFCETERTSNQIVIYYEEIK